MTAKGMGIIFFHGIVAPIWPGPPHCQEFIIRHTTPGTTPLDERSERRSDLYLTIHNIQKRHP